MEKTERHRILDIGGGPDWQPWLDHPDWLPEAMANLRVAQLAREDSDGIYIVLDKDIPRPEAETLLSELPNLYFVESELTQASQLSFAGASVDRIEMNHMWTPLTDMPRLVERQEIKGLPGAIDYLHALEESCRILKPGGILSITEKEDRLDRVRSLLSRDSYLELDGFFMHQLGLDTDTGAISLTEVTDSNRSQYTGRAIESQKKKVYCLELVKK